MIKAEKEINIGGKKRLLKLGTNSTAIFCDMYNIPLAEFDTYLQNPTMAHYRDLVYSCLKDGARKKGEEFTASPETVGDWLDEDGKMEAVMEFLGSIKAPQNAKETPKKGSSGGGSKKKQ